MLRSFLRPFAEVAAGPGDSAVLCQQALWNNRETQDMKRWTFIVGCLAVLVGVCGLACQAAEGQQGGTLRILVFGAHPDDCEIRCGGVAVLWSARGDLVKFVSTTKGDIGHWGMAGGPLAVRRLTGAGRRRVCSASPPKCSTSTTAKSCRHSDRRCSPG